MWFRTTLCRMSDGCLVRVEPGTLNTCRFILPVLFPDGLLDRTDMLRFTCIQTLRDEQLSPSAAPGMLRFATMSARVCAAKRHFNQTSNAAGPLPSSRFD